LSNTAPNAVRATAKAEFLYAPAASDKIQAFAIDRATGAVSEVAGSPFRCAAGRGKYPVGNIAVDPAARFVYCSSTKTDKIVGYTIETSTGALTPIAGSSFTDPNGAPTVLAITPDATHLYVEHETYPSETNKISGYSIDPTTGALSLLPGSPFSNGDEATFSMIVAPSGKSLYISENRMNGSIAGFTIDPASGNLTSIQGSPYPAAPNVRGLAIGSRGRYLYVPGSANMGTTPDFIIGYIINSENGSLGALPYYDVSGDVGAVAVRPSGQYLYAPYSSGNQAFILALAVDRESGTYHQIHGSPFGARKAQYPAVAMVDPRGKFLYVTSKNHLGAYAIDQRNGRLSRIAGSPFDTGRFTGQMTIASPK
jgi:6-phosphogluconolactonase